MTESQLLDKLQEIVMARDVHGIQITIEDRKPILVDISYAPSPFSNKLRRLEFNTGEKFLTKIITAITEMRKIDFADRYTE